MEQIWTHPDDYPEYCEECGKELNLKGNCTSQTCFEARML